jgi:hypothetical protein
MRLARALRLCIAAQRHRSTLRPHQHACCEEADFASLGWIEYAEKRWTDASLVLDASTRVAAAARSGLIDLHFAFVVDHADGSQTASTGRAHVRCCKEADLASLGGSNTPSRRSTRARRIFACSSRRKKRPHRSALCTAGSMCRISLLGFFVGPKRNNKPNMGRRSQNV